MFKATMLGLLAHKLRLALAAIAVVLGVAFVSGTLVLSDTLSTAFDTLFHTTTAGVDVSVRGVGTLKGDGGRSIHPPIPRATLATVRGVGGVKEAFGAVQRTASLIGHDGKIISTGGAPNLGLLWNPYPDMTALHLRAGRAPHGVGEVVIDAKTAADKGFSVGNSISVLLPQQAPRTFTISGLTGFGDQDTLLGATIAVFDTDAGGPLLGAPDEYDQIEVKAVPGVNADALKARVAAVLPSGTEAVTGQTVAREQSDAVKTGLGFLSTLLFVFAAISLFVGSFIILNTFSILVTQRQRELALMRALGASRGQVMRSVLVESLVTGLLASLLGVAAGLGIAKLLEALLGALGLDLGGTSLQFLAHTPITGILVGVIVTVVASLVPARRATRVSPVEALRESAPSPSAVSRGRVVTGLLILAGGVGVLMLGLFVVSDNQLSLVGAGALGTFIGVAVLAPIAVPPVVAVLGRPVAALRGVPGRLARENARRNPRRTATTASALMVGVGLISCFTVVGASAKASINKIVDRTVTADYIISAQTQSQEATLSLAVAQRVRAVPSAAVVSEVSGGDFAHGSQSDSVSAIDPATITGVGIVDVQHGAPITSLGDGDVAISEDAAKNQSLKVGDTLPMQFQRPGIHRQNVATIYARNPLFGDYLVTLTLYRSAAIRQGDFVVLVKGRDGVDQATLRGDLDAVVKQFPSVQVQNNAEYKKDQGNQIDTLLALLTVLLVLAIVIALLGVINTMALSIIERVRELGLVRALGMTRRQTRRMVRWETVIITVFGALLGLVVGIGFGIALQRALSPQGFDVLDIAPGQQAVYVLVAFFAGLVAAIFPAMRASRVDMLAAIASE